MAKSEPRIQLDPEIAELIDAAARVAGMSRRAYVEYAVRSTVMSAERVGQFQEIAAFSLTQLAELASKIDGISDFITDRYITDLAEVTDDQDV